jgi:hypothetical protein
MPITPLAVTGMFEILIDDGDMKHKTQLHVNVQSGPDVGATQNIEAVTGLSDNITDAQLYTKFTDAVKALYDVGSSFIGWRVWRYIDGVKTLYNEASTIVAGTDTSSSPVYSPANQITWFFKDTLFKPVKVVVLGNAIEGAGPQRLVSLTGHTALAAARDEFANLGATHLGNFIKSRGNRQITYYGSVVLQRNNSSENRRLRALRG